MGSSRAHATLEIGHTWNGEPLAAGERVRLELESSEAEWTLEVDAPYYRDPAPPTPIGSTHGLWDYEVVELFLLTHGQRYLEIELGPRGHYLVLALCGPREIEQAGLTIDYEALSNGDRWRGRARIPKHYLSGTPHAFNAYAMHGQGAERRYLAAHPVPGDAADFHRLEFFQPLRLR